MSQVQVLIKEGEGKELATGIVTRCENSLELGLANDPSLPTRQQIHIEVSRN